MKRVLVLNGDSYVGERVIKQFYAAREYEIEITQCPRDVDDDAPLAYRQHNSRASGNGAHHVNTTSTISSSNSSSTHATRLLAAGAVPATSASPSAPALRPHRSPPPSYLMPSATAVVPPYNAQPLEFCACVLENDIIVAIVDDDPTEAECAIKALMNSHYEVEKTFVLVSSALTWANTLVAERALARHNRRAQREQGRRAHWEEMLNDALADGAEETDEEVISLRARLRDPDAFARDEDLPAELREPVEELADDELVPSRVFGEEEYASRVPHPRYQHTKNVEHLVKRANSATLHTYVLFAGLPYGAGEGPLFPLFLSAFQYVQDGAAASGGSVGATTPSAPLGAAMALLQRHPILAQHVIPMIHVDDLAALIFRAGAAYDVQQERYLFAVDRGSLTLRQLVQIIAARIGQGNANVLTSSYGTNAPPLSQEDVTNYLDATVPPPKTLEELRALYENDSVGELLFSGSSSVLRSFFLSDIRAEPAAAFSFLPEEEWRTLEGFAEAVDKVAFQFRKQRVLPPTRVLVTGPPLSGSETVAASLAAQYGVPLLTIGAVTAEFEAHATAVRAELVELLARQIQRRWDRGHLRRVKEVMAERAEKAALVAERKAEKKRVRAEEREARRAAGEEGSGSEEDEGDEEEDEGSDDGEEGEGDGSQDASETSSVALGKGDGAISELSLVFSEDREHTERRLAEILTERYILGYTEDREEGDVELTPEDEEGVEEDEAMLAQAEEDAEQEATEQEEEGNAGALRARLRALVAIRAIALQENIRIRALRLQYRLARKALSMRLVNGALPRPRTDAADDEEDEEAAYEEDEEGDDNANGRGPWGASSDADEAEEGDEELEASGEEDEEQEDGSATPEESEVSSAFTAGRRNRTIAANAAAQQADPRASRKGKLFPATQTVEYLDEAKTFFMRWRLRQADCRNRGYVMHNFPSTVREACLLFYASGAADADGGDVAEVDDAGQPLLPPTSVEEVPAPVDADFPFASLENFSEEQLRALEEDIRADRLRIVDPHEEGVLAAVQERSFPDHVIVLDDKDETLRALAAAMDDDKRRRDIAARAEAARLATTAPDLIGEGSALLPVKGEARMHGSRAGSPHRKDSVMASNGTVVRKKNAANVTPAGNASLEVADIQSEAPQASSDAASARGGSASAVAVAAASSPLDSRAIATSRTPSATPPTFAPVPSLSPVREVPMPKESEEERRLAQCLSALVDAVLVSGDDFYKQLDSYRKHHKLPSSDAVAAPPTESLITWLQSVRTREVVGATAEPIVIHAPKKHIGTGNDDKEADNDEDGEENRAALRAAPVTARAAQVDILAAPPRDASGMRAELLAVLGQSKSLPSLLRAIAGTSAAAAEEASSGKAIPTLVFAPNRLAPDAANAAPSASAAAAAPPPQHYSQTTQPLQWLADKLTRSILPSPALSPGTVTAGAPAASAPIPATEHAPRSSPPTATAAMAGDLAKSPEAVAAIETEQHSNEEMESAVLAQLRVSESTFHAELELREETELRRERNALRLAQVKEECLGVWSAAQLPKESYLMKYVLPQLTPAMREVVRLRPEDPVTALADLLYNYQSGAKNGVSAADSV